MGVSFLHPMGKLGERPFYRVEGETDLAQLIAGQLSIPTAAYYRSIEGGICR
jgi:hypothetical protein